jgi:hypothetical protein
LISSDIEERGGEISYSDARSPNFNDREIEMTELEKAPDDSDSRRRIDSFDQRLASSEAEKRRSVTSSSDVGSSRSNRRYSKVSALKEALDRLEV